MAQLSKVGFQVELQSSAVQFFGFLKNDLSKVVQIFPDQIKCLQLIEGNYSTPGSVLLIKYTLGVAMSATIKIAAIDENEKSIVYEFIEGDMLKVYNSVKAKIQLADGTLKWDLEFEKANEAMPNPDLFVKLAANVVKGLDNFLCRN